MPATLIYNLLNSLVTVMDTDWPAGSTPRPTIAREYYSEDDARSVSGRKIYFFPLKLENTFENQSEDNYYYRFGVVFIERYTTAGKPTKLWIDERIRVVTEDVWEYLGDARDPLVSGFSPEEAEITSYYNSEQILKGLFVSTLEFVYRAIV